jgi:hypothetical protein
MLTPAEITLMARQNAQRRDDAALRVRGIARDASERKFNPTQPRDPGGEDGGQWIKSPVGAAKAVAKVIAKAVTTNQHRKSRANIVVRPDLAIANTPERVAEIFNIEVERITGRRIPVKFGSSVRTAQEHAEGLLRGLERFPNAKLTRVGEFSRNTYGGDLYATAYAVASSDGVIEFNDEWTSTQRRGRYEAHLMLGVDSGFHTPGSYSPASTAIHEFGHVMDIGTLGQAIHRRVGALLNERAAAEGITRSALVKREISGYAAKNMSELVAEVFTDVLMNGDDASPLSREIFAMLEEEYWAEHGGAA